jgi:hypothetical protein
MATTLQLSEKRLIKVTVSTPGGDQRYGLWFDIWSVDEDWGWDMDTGNYNRYESTGCSIKYERFSIKWKIMDHNHVFHFQTAGREISYDNHEHLNGRIQVDS